MSRSLSGSRPRGGGSRLTWTARVGARVADGLVFGAGVLLTLAAFEKLLYPTHAVEAMGALGLGDHYSIILVSAMIGLEFAIGSLWVTGLGGSRLRAAAGATVLLLVAGGLLVQGVLEGRSCGCFGARPLPMGWVRAICAAGGVVALAGAVGRQRHRAAPASTRRVAFRVLVAVACIWALRSLFAPDVKHAFETLEQMLGDDLAGRPAIAIIGSEDCPKCDRIVDELLRERAAGRRPGPDTAVFLVTPPRATGGVPAGSTARPTGGAVRVLPVADAVWWGLLDGGESPVILERCRGCDSWVARPPTARPRSVR